MKKKVLSLILVIAVLASFSMLTACGATPTTTTAGTTTVTDATTAGGTTAAAVEPLKIKFSSTFQQTETGGEIIQHFIDEVGEMSDGAITVEIAWGGTLFPAPDELDAVATGAVDMIALGHMPHLSILNYLSFPSFAPGGTQAALDYFQTLMFDDPETSKLIQDEATANGVKYLNVIAGGANAFCAKYAFADLASLVAGSSAFGNMDAAIFEKLGFKVTMAFPPDVYDGLNRGLFDSTEMALAPMVGLSWYEVAPFWALDGTYAAGNFFTVNLEWWDALSNAHKAIIQEAATETQAYSATLYDEAIGTLISTVETKTGNKFVELSDADLATIWAAVFDAKAKAALEIAGQNDKTDGMQKILAKAAEITDYDYKP